MEISSLLSPESIICIDNIYSKKRALEVLSELLSQNEAVLSKHLVFNTLLARERLGSTALGNGIAIPHARHEMAQKPKAAMLIFTDNGIDFDAPDNQRVNLIFALLVPANEPEQHLKILSSLAHVFSQNNVISEICKQSNKTAMLSYLNSLFPPLEHAA